MRKFTLTLKSILLFEVQVRFVVLHISNVNIVTNTFEASIKLTADWVADKDVVMATCQSRAATFNSGLLEWHPEIQPAALSLEEGEGWSPPDLCFERYVMGRHDAFILRSSITFTGVFQELFELENFPVDCQDLQINFSPVLVGTGSGITFEKVQFFPAPDKFVNIVTECIHETDFRYCKANVEFCRTDPSNSRYGRTYSEINLNLKIQRRWEHYFFRLCIVLSVVTLSGCTAFQMDLEEDFPDGAAFLSTCLLTIVAFMFVVQQTLPSIPYLTLLDGFVYAMLLFVGFQIILLNLFNVQSLNMKEEIVLYISVAVWFSIHLFFGVLAWYKKTTEARKLDMGGEELKKLFKSQKKRYFIERKGESIGFLGTVWGKFQEN